MSLSVETLAVARKYTDDSLAGAGAVAGVPCQIQSKTAITGGTRITFLWVDNNGNSHTTAMDVMNGIDGQDGKGIQSVSVNENNHLIITYSDGTTDDAGQIEIHSAVDSVNGQTGNVTLDAEDVGALPDDTPIPSKTSDLTNDSGFITKVVNDLVSYYLKSETYSKTEVDDIVTAIKNSRFEVVATLPTTDIKTNVIYLVPKSPSQTSNVKDEYINLDGTTSGWEKIGDTEIDLSNYVTIQALNTALANYTTTADLTTLLAGKQDTLTFDNAPTENSNNPVKSGGVFTSEQDIFEVMGQNGAKNLIPYPYAETTKTQNGVTFTDNGDGTITVNGTASANTLFTISTVLADVLLNDNTTEYILSGCEGGGGATYKLVVDDISDYSIICNQFDNEADFTIASSHHGIRASIVVYSGQVMSNVIFKPMVRLASDTDSTYQPYAKTNKQLTDDAEALMNQANDMVNVLGAKNLIPYPYHRQNGYTTNGATFTYDDEGVITVNKVAGNATAYFGLFSNTLYPNAEIFIVPNTSYILSMELENATDTSCFVQTQTGIDLAAIRNKATGKYEISFTTPETMDFLAVSLYYGAATTENNAKVKLMIRLASISDDTYVPYAKTNQQLTEDSIDWDNFSELGAVNMLDFTHASEVRKGYTFTNTDGVVTVTGSRASGETGNADHYVNITLTKGTYKVSGCPSGGSDDTWRLLVNINDGAKYAFDYGDGAVFTLTEESSLRVYCTIMANYSDTVNLTFYPMITVPSYNGDYVPYAKTNQELTSDSVTWDDLREVGAVNYLVYPYSETTHTSSNIIYTDNGDGSITVGTGTTSSGSPGSYAIANNTKDIQRLRGKAVKFSIDCDTVIDGNNANVQIAIYDSSNNLLYNHYLHMNGGRDKTILTVPSNADHVYIQAWNKRSTTISTAYTVKPMITPVSYNGPYVPYAKTNRELTEKIDIVGNLFTTTTKVVDNITHGIATTVATLENLPIGTYVVSGQFNSDSAMSGGGLVQFASSGVIQNGASCSTIINQGFKANAGLTGIFNVTNATNQINLQIYTANADLTVASARLAAIRIA